MKLFILATLVGSCLAQGDSDTSSRQAALAAENEQSRAQIAAQMTGKLRDTALAVYDYLNAGNSMTDAYDNVIAKSGLSSDDINNMTLQVEGIVAKIEGRPAPVHHHFTSQEIAAATGINQDEVSAIEAAVESAKSAASSSSGPVPPPSSSGGASAISPIPIFASLPSADSLSSSSNGNVLSNVGDSVSSGFGGFLSQAQSSLQSAAQSFQSRASQAAENFQGMLQSLQSKAQGLATQL